MARAFVKLPPAIGFRKFYQSKRFVRRIIFDNLNRFIRASAVNDDYLVNIDQPRKRVESFADGQFLIISRDDNGNLKLNKTD